MLIKGLILTNILLILVLVGTWQPSQGVQTEALPPQLSPLTLPASHGPGPVGGLDALARPVFWPQRRPSTDGGDQLADGTAQPIEGLRGVMGSGEQGVILVHRDNGIQRLRVGDTLDQWTLVGIEGNAVILRGPAGTILHQTLPQPASDPGPPRRP
ncbi:hypothetical protein SAMN05421693_10944 [Ectothiorhodospira magna]|uniref:Uncharacterized protein n=1 Tax=Ectothiorhodospira magna TaxID=867345 RepID=A0A1H9BIV7_9GAMM|nr:hypothetical protein [Ectothiorhodospira magna]SEP88922.1 hypothetical protein SAMN05421693_10944 [Ectothiorhodospira magna]